MLRPEFRNSSLNLQLQGLNAWVFIQVVPYLLHIDVVPLVPKIFALSLFVHVVYQKIYNEYVLNIYGSTNSTWTEQLFKINPFYAYTKGTCP